MERKKTYECNKCGNLNAIDAELCSTCFCIATNSNNLNSDSDEIVSSSSISL